MSDRNQNRENLILFLLLYLGEHEDPSVSLHEIANVLGVSFLDVLWGTVLLGRAGYVEYESHSPMQVRLTRQPGEIDVYRVTEKLQEILEQND